MTYATERAEFEQARDERRRMRAEAIARRGNVSGIGETRSIDAQWMARAYARVPRVARTGDVIVRPAVSVRGDALAWTSADRVARWAEARHAIARDDEEMLALMMPERFGEHATEARIDASDVARHLRAVNTIDDDERRAAAYATLDAPERPRVTHRRPLFVGRIPDGFAAVIGTSFPQRASRFGYRTRAAIGRVRAAATRKRNAPKTPTAIGPSRADVVTAQMRDELRAAGFIGNVE